jgi:hypothetical protein
LRRPLLGLEARLAVPAALLLACTPFTGFNDRLPPTADAGGGADTADLGAPPVCIGSRIPCGRRCVLVATDPLNCGACGLDCRGGTCQAGRCQPVVVADQQDQPIALGIAARRLYWANAATDQILSISLDVPADLPVLVAGGQSDVYVIDGDTEAAYWASAASGTISRFSPVGLETVFKADPGPVALVLTPEDVYWVDGDGGHLFGSARSTIAPRPLFAGGVFLTDLAATASTLVVADRGSDPTTGTGADLINGELVAVQLDGGTDVLANGTRPEAVAVVGDDVYWLDGAAGRVKRVSRSGGSPAEITAWQSAASQPTPQALFASPSRVLWVTPISSGSVVELDLASGRMTELASGQSWPTAVTEDGDTVLWVNSGRTDVAGDGQVMRVVRAPAGQGP